MDKTTHERVTQAIHECMKPIIDELAQVIEGLEYLRDHFIPVGQCFTLPNGECLGNRCMHDARMEHN